MLLSALQMNSPYIQEGICLGLFWNCLTILHECQCINTLLPKEAIIPTEELLIIHVPSVCFPAFPRELKALCKYELQTINNAIDFEETYLWGFKSMPPWAFSQEWSPHFSRARNHLLSSPVRKNSGLILPKWDWEMWGNKFVMMF